jgi:hypothetical protein
MCVTLSASFSRARKAMTVPPTSASIHGASPTTAIETATDCCPVEMLHGIQWTPNARCIDGHEVQRQCPNSEELGLLRQCHRMNDEWTWSAIVSQCQSLVIAELASISMNLPDAKTNVADLLDDLSDAIRNASHLSAADVDFVAEILNATLTLIENGEANLTVNFTSAYIQVVDTMVDSDVMAAADGSGGTAAIAASVDQFALILSLELGSDEKGVSQVVGRNIVVTTVTMDFDEEIRWPVLPVDHVGVTLCSSDSGCSQTQHDDTSTGTDHSGTRVSLPPLRSLLNSSATDTTALAQAIFVVFATDQLFKTSGSETVMDSVITATIVNARPGGYFDPDQFMTFTISHPVAITTHNLATRRPGWFDESSRRWNSSGCVVVDELSTESSTTCRCEHLTSFAVLMDSRRGNDGTSAASDDNNAKALSIITLIGCGASIVCLFVTVVAYIIFPRARTFSKAVLQHLAGTLLVGMVLFVAAVSGDFNAVGCKTVGSLLHYFLLAAFCWMAVEGFLLHRTFVVLFFHRAEEARLFHRFFALAYGAPAVVAGMTAYLTGLGEYNEGVCWLSGPAIWAFICPVLVVVAINAWIYLKIMRIIMAVHSDKSAGPLSTLKRGAHASASVFALMGITWVFGLMSLQNGDQIVYQYAFAFFNAFGGVWIFLLHCANDSNVRSEFFAIKTRHKRWSTARRNKRSTVTYSSSAQGGVRWGGRKPSSNTGHQQPRRKFFHKDHSLPLSSFADDEVNEWDLKANANTYSADVVNPAMRVPVGMLSGEGAPSSHHEDEPPTFDWDGLMRDGVLSQHTSNEFADMERVLGIMSVLGTGESHRNAPQRAHSEEPAEPSLLITRASPKLVLEE